MYPNTSVIGFRVEVAVEPDDKGFHAFCPALKGLHTYGDTEEEALQHARDAAVAYLESCLKHGDPIPVGVVAARNPGAGCHRPTKRATLHTEDLQVACTT